MQKDLMSWQKPILEPYLCNKKMQTVQQYVKVIILALQPNGIAT